MNVHLNPNSNYSISLFKEKILLSLTALQTKIVSIASIAFRLLAACYTSVNNLVNPWRKTYPDGSVGTGEFKNGLLNGKGKRTFPNGEIWEGEFKDNQLNGEGKKTDPDGVVSEGEFKNDLLFRGKKTKPVVYLALDSEGRFEEVGESEFKANKRDDIAYDLNDQGKILISRDVVYEGEFKDDKLTGQGKVTFTDGRRLEGEFKDGCLNGQGKMNVPIKIVCDEQGRITSRPRATYEGEFKDGKLNGQGKATYTRDKSDTLMEGEFRDFMLIRGKCSLGENAYYEGEFNQKGLNGQGKEIFFGRTSEGTFIDGVLCGKGKITDTDGNTLEGNFDCYQLTGQGIRTYPNGVIHEGEFKNSLLNGKGKIIYSKEVVIHGTFENGKFISE